VDKANEIIASYNNLNENEKKAQEKDKLGYVKEEGGGEACN